MSTSTPEQDLSLLLRTAAEGGLPVTIHGSRYVPEARVTALEDLLRRLAVSHEDLVAETDDPGTEALSILYLVRQVVATGPAPQVDALDVDAIATDLEDFGLSGAASRLAAVDVADGIRRRLGLV